jgi:hypothetical protein
MCRDPARRAHASARGKIIPDLTYGAGDVVSASERIHLLLKQPLELLAANRKKFVFFHQH